MKQLTGWDWTAIVLVIIGGLNWGLIALGTSMAILARIIYGLVGIAAIYMVFTANRLARK